MYDRLTCNESDSDLAVEQLFGGISSRFTCSRETGTRFHGASELPQWAHWRKLVVHTPGKQKTSLKPTIPKKFQASAPRPEQGPMTGSGLSKHTASKSSWIILHPRRGACSVFYGNLFRLIANETEEVVDSRLNGKCNHNGIVPVRARKLV